MTEFDIAWWLSEYGPFGGLLIYMAIMQLRMKRAIMCLAKNTKGVDSDEVEESFRVIDGLLRKV